MFGGSVLCTETCTESNLSPGCVVKLTVHCSFLRLSTLGSPIHCLARGLPFSFPLLFLKLQHVVHMRHRKQELLDSVV